MSAGPGPWWARALVRVVAGPDEAPYVVADLAEEFATLAASRGARVARRWYAAQVLRSVFPFLRHRLSHARAAALSSGITMHLGSDLRGAVRQLFRSPVTGGAAILTVALGAGATAAVLAVAHGVLLQPLPLGDASRLVWVHTGTARQPRASISSNPGDFDAWLAAPAIAAAVAWAPGEDATLALGAEPWRGDVVRISDGAAAVLQRPPALGRWFQPEEFVARSGVVMLTYRTWRAAFGADSTIVGRMMLVDDAPARIVGVAPDLGDAFPAADADLWRPEPTRNAGHGPLYLRVVARLRPGATLAGAEGELTAIAQRLAAEFPATNGDRRTWLQPYRDGLVEGAEPTLLLIAGTVALVLLIACHNFANVQLARALDRRREFAVRAAIGGTAVRLRRQIIIELLVPALLGLALGQALAPFLVQALIGLYPGGLPRAGAVHLSPAVTAAAAALTLLAAAVAVLPLTRQANRGNLSAALRAGDRGSRSRGAQRTAHALVAFQVAMAVVLLFGGALLLRTFHTLAGRDPGFDRRGLVAFSVAPTVAHYPSDTAAFDYLHRVATRVRAVPGVEASGVTTLLPYDAGNLASIVWPAGAPHTMDAAFFPITHGVSPGYLSALGLPVLQGRGLVEGDRWGPPVALISERLAARLWPDASPVGRRIETRTSSIEVVGVVGNKRHRSLRDDPPMEVYLPREQSWYYSRAHWVVARVAGRPERAAPALLAAAREVDPATPPARFTTLESRIAGSLAPERFRGVLVGALGALALVLTVIGLWGTVAQLVSRQTREIGVRIALGQSPGGAGRRVIAAAMRTVGVGLVAGLALALGAGRLLAGFLVGVTAFDPASLVGIVTLFAAITWLAALGPARRAGRVDPLVAIRSEDG